MLLYRLLTVSGKYVVWLTNKDTLTVFWSWKEEYEDERSVEQKTYSSVFLYFLSAVAASCVL